MSMTFTPVNREDIPAVSTRTTSESAVLFEGFLASETEIAMVGIEHEADADAEAQAAKIASVRSTLGNYIDRHSLAVKLFTRNSALYMEKITADEVATRKAKLEAKRAAKAGVTVEAEPEADYS